MYLVLALTLAAPAALAQRRDRPTQGSSGLTGEADERFRRGVQLATEGNYQGALVEFRRAYELSQNGLVLFNIGAMHVELNQFGEGLDALQEYERVAPAAVVRARRAQLDALLQRVRTRSGTITVPLTLEGLRVQIESVGVTPMRVVREGAAASAPVRLPIGRYRVTVSAPGYRPSESEHDLAGDQALRIDRALDPNLATLTIRANVHGAEVRIDDRAVGFSPLGALELTQGSHRIEVTRPGYNPFRTTVNVEGTLGVIEANLQWATSLAPNEAGRMALDRAYTDVECELDGHRIACDGSDAVPPGPHTLRVTGRDYVTHEQQVRLEPGRVTRVEATLIPRPEAIRESQERGNGQRRLGFVIGGVGLAVAIGGGVWFAIAMSDHSADLALASSYQSSLEECGRIMVPLLRDQCLDREFMGRLDPTNREQDAMRMTNALNEQVNESRNLVIGSGVVLGVGVAALITGAVIVGTAPGDRFANPPPRRATLRPQFTPTLNGFGLRF